MEKIFFFDNWFVVALLSHGPEGVSPSLANIFIGWMIQLVYPSSSLNAVAGKKQ
jgi:hypothetical protein